VYVNTDNLILRDRPVKIYRVFSILHAPCKLTLQPYDKGYVNDKKITDRFYHVLYTYEEDGMHYRTRGWVEKKYVVSDRSKITVPVADTQLDLNMSVVYMEPYFGDYEHNPNPFNAAKFLPPKYKGGDPHPYVPSVTRVYYTGPLGGCYYIGKNGRKVYVDKHFCDEE
jgi:hypothetical protein